MLQKKEKIIDVKLVGFALYNLAYVLFSVGYIGQSLNLAILFFLSMWHTCELLIKTKGVFNRKKLFFFDEMLMLLSSVLLIGGISLIIQIVHLDVRLSYLSSYMYLIFPILFAFAWINTTSKENMMVYMYVMLGRFLLTFIIENISKISLNSLKMITFNDSRSSVFESPDAHGFFILMIIFISVKKEKMAWLCGIFCMLSFKRLSFVLTPIILLGNKFIPQKRTNTKLIILCQIFFIMSPYLILFLLYNTEEINYIFGINLNELTTGRFSIVNYVLENIEIFNGFGSINEFMDKNPWGIYVTITQMHCDVLQLYLETTILGVIVYFRNLFKLAKQNYYMLIIILYFALEMLTSHFLDVLFVWMLLYMYIAMLKVYNNANRSKEW